jgi:hypothetical protein
MSAKTINDLTVNNTAISFEKLGAAQPVTCEVQIRDDRGGQTPVNFAVATVLTAGEQTAFNAIMVKLYNAAKTLAGFTG